MTAATGLLTLIGLKVNMIKSQADRLKGFKYLGFGFYFDTSQNKEKNLVKSAIDRNTARRAVYTGERIAYVCNKEAVNVAINNKRLASSGLISMLDYKHFHLFAHHLCAFFGKSRTDSFFFRLRRCYVAQILDMCNINAADDCFYFSLYRHIIKNCFITQ